MTEPLPDPKDVGFTLPKGAPKWAVGITSVLSALGILFVVVWTYTQPLIQKEVDASITTRSLQNQSDITTVGALLEMVRGYQVEISKLSEAVLEAQRGANKLAEKATELEKQLHKSASSLSECEAKLKTCRK